ncbi:MAG: glycerol-3-phosphate 1-O-acyltransferase PlsY [Nitrospiraceae bacterium]|nr:glycerol-3-phosphate 1-O-acyltransferase PlsY [Nitrospiraceae bacterium]
MKPVLLGAIAFLLGSIPTGMLVAGAKGIDLRGRGSGNIGATNVLRTTGKGAALLTLLGDGIKGALAVLIARHFGAGVFYEGMIGVCAVLGHNYSVFLKFRGGKGVATSIGVLSIYSPQTGAITIIIWLMTVLITRYSSLGALVSFGILPFSAFFIDATGKLPVYLLLTLMIFVRHRENILRLIAGAEQKIGGRL